MTQLYERTARQQKAFGDGVAAQLAGGTTGDNPFTAADMAKLAGAWLRGFEAAVGPSAWAISTAYTIGQLVTNGGNVYQCVWAGTSAGSGGPSGTDERIVDNTTVWKYQNSGTDVDLTRAGLTKAGEPAYISAFP